MTNQTDIRILSLMIEKCDRLIEICSNHNNEEISSNYIYSDAIQFEFEKLYEDSTRLSAEFRLYHQELHIDDLRGIRNRVAHDYESVSLKILLDTVRDDIPVLRNTLSDFLEKETKNSCQRQLFFYSKKFSILLQMI